MLQSGELNEKRLPNGHAAYGSTDEAVAAGSVWNTVAGSVVSIHQGLTNTGMHLHIGEHTTLRLRRPSDAIDGQMVRIGQKVTAHLALDSVLLAMPGKWPGKDRWNRWSGRIVLVEPAASSSLITVKVQGEQWTLKSRGLVLGSDRPPRTWDHVNIVVDPARVALRQLTVDESARTAWPMAVHARGLTGGRVWLRGFVQAIRQVPTGWLLSLDIGGARVSALVCAEAGLPWHVMPGVQVEVHVGQWEAWIKPCGIGREPVQGRLLYQDIELSGGIGGHGPSPAVMRPTK